MKSGTSKLLTTALFLLLLIGIPLLLLLLNSNGQRKGQITVDAVIEAPFVTQASSKETVLLFFGYVGCSAICSPFLEELHDFYRDPRLDTKRDEIDVLFVNLLSDIEPEQADQFAQSFDSDFKGLYLDTAALRKIEREFQLLFSPSLLEKNELNHTDHLYLLQRTDDERWHLERYYFIHPLNHELLYKDLLKEDR